MFGLTTTRRLRATQHENSSLNIKLSLLQALYNGASRRLRTAEAQREKGTRRLTRTLRAVAHWRAEAARAHRTARLLAEQLLDATSGQNTAARDALGLHTDPWQRATDGLNALIDAAVPFHIEPDGHISNPSGDEHIEYDLLTKRWRLVHNADDEPRPAADA
ncbi:hypothetical protein [Streptomyces sp. NPDC057617]|uniref:hypothetical protein n=1 Tax=Streptomyces sp. NPDC057617 TaxID=3346184 RepID=UPI00367DB661